MAHVHADDRHQFDPAWERFRRGLRNRVLGLTSMALAGGGAIALASYNRLDPSFNVASGLTPANRLGEPGAYAADALLQGLGAGSVALLIILFVAGWRLFHKGSIVRRWGHGLSQCALIGLTLLFTCATLSALPIPRSWPLGTDLGGMMGQMVHGLIAHGVGGAVAGALFLFAASLAWMAFLRITPEALARKGRLLLVGLDRTSQALASRLRLPRIPLPDLSFLLGRGGEERPVWREAMGRLDETPASPHQDLRPVRPERPLTPETPPRPKNAPRRGRPVAVRPVAGLPFQLPPLTLLAEPKRRDGAIDEGTLRFNMSKLQTVLAEFKIKGEVVGARPGPVVTLYEFEPAPGVKASQVIGVSEDLARSMSALSARVAVVPGRSVIGIELPNRRRETVFLRAMLSAPSFSHAKGTLPVALGESIEGEPVFDDLAKMPHMLVAGATGAGKSVGLNAIILSLLYRFSPDQCRFVMIDPKMLELSVYDDIPHLLAPVVTDPKKAVSALKWTVREMEARYRTMSKLGVRNMAGFNARVAEAQARGETLERVVQTGFDDKNEPIYESQTIAAEPIPNIVVIIDEMADLMVVAGKDIEAAVQRLAQMARAAGIHLIMATQRPSVDVITGVIKANFPTRLSYQVSSKIDSRTILNEQGAEQLLGQGDCLYQGQGRKARRLHGPFVSDEEVEKVANFLRKQGKPVYVDDITAEPENDDTQSANSQGELFGGEDGGSLYEQARAIVIRDQRASTSYVQRRLSIGYNRAATLIEQLEEEGVISAANHAGKRDVLIDPGEDAD